MIDLYLKVELLTKRANHKLKMIGFYITKKMNKHLSREGQRSFRPLFIYLIEFGLFNNYFLHLIIIFVQEKKLVPK